MSARARSSGCRSRRLRQDRTRPRVGWRDPVQRDRSSWGTARSLVLSARRDARGYRVCPRGPEARCALSAALGPRKPLLPMASRSQPTRHRQRRPRAQLATQTAGRFGVRTRSLDAPVAELSGGNQQKVVLGRTFALTPDVVVLGEPTRGIDVGAKSEIYRYIQEMAAEGKAIVMISSELPELLGLADRSWSCNEVASPPRSLPPRRPRKPSHTPRWQTPQPWTESHESTRSCPR